MIGIGGRRLLLSPSSTRHAASSALRSRPASSATTTSTPTCSAMIVRSRSRVVSSSTLPPPAKKNAGGSASSSRLFGDKAADPKPPAPGGGWWDSAEFWGRCGAIAGWGMSGAAIYDAIQSSPELISLNMTGVLLVYSALFSRWALVVKPRNLLLAGCHVTNVAAQSNQLRRAIEYKRGQGGKDDEINDVLMKAAGVVAAGAVCVAGGPTLQSAIVGANLGPISALAAAEAGPFTVHFWAPMSKWMISGASFLELDRPTEKISIAQYTALTLTGFFFTRYALLVAPVNYTLCSVNIALFGSSAWHLGRKIKADFLS